MLTLNIPQQRDPIARWSLIGAIVLVAYAAFVSATAPTPATAQAESDPIIIVATPSLPTPAPALALIAPTPQVVFVEVPGPTPEPQIVYVESQTAPPAQPLAPAVEAAPAYDPTLHPDAAADALTQARQDLPTAGAPPDANAEAAAAAYQQRRLESGAYRPRTR